MRDTIGFIILITFLMFVINPHGLGNTVHEFMAGIDGIVTQGVSK